MTSDPRLIAALRRAGSETQITDAIAAVCQDRRAAAGFVQAVLSRSPRPPAWLPRLPGAFACRREVAVSGGRVDLVFEGGAGDEQTTVFVELKVHSGYGRDQLPRYLAALPSAPAHAAAVAVTRTAPRSGEAAAMNDARFAGSVRWGRILPLLRRLAPMPAEVGVQWRALLDVLEEEGSMGFTTPDADLLVAWTKARRAEAHVVLLVDALEETARGIELRLGSGGEHEATQPFKTAASGRRIHVTGGDARFGLRIPRGGPERIRLGLRGWQPPLRAMLAVRAAKDGDDPAFARRASLLANGYEERAGSRFLVKYREISETEMSDPDLPELVGRWLEGEAERLTALGLDALWAGEPAAEAAERPEG